MAGKKQGGRMSVAEAGRKGGQKVASERGRAFYVAIGQKGGQIGGEKVSQDRGHMAAIGHKGGERVRELIEKGKKNP